MSSPQNNVTALAYFACAPSSDITKLKERLQSVQQAYSKLCYPLPSSDALAKLSQSLERINQITQRYEAVQKNFTFAKSAFACVAMTACGYQETLAALSGSLDELSDRLSSLSAVPANDFGLLLSEPLTMRILDDSDAVLNCIEPLDTSGIATTMQDELHKVRNTPFLKLSFEQIVQIIALFISLVGLICTFLPNQELADIRCLLEENLSAIHELMDSLPASDALPDSEEPECYDC